MVGLEDSTHSTGNALADIRPELWPLPPGEGWDMLTHVSAPGRRPVRLLGRRQTRLELTLFDNAVSAPSKQVHLSKW